MGPAGVNQQGWEVASPVEMPHGKVLQAGPRPRKIGADRVGHVPGTRGVPKLANMWERGGGGGGGAGGKVSYLE